MSFIATGISSPVSNAVGWRGPFSVTGAAAGSPTCAAAGLTDVWTGSDECTPAASSAATGAELAELGMMLGLLLGTLSGGAAMQSGGLGPNGFSPYAFSAGAFSAGGFPVGAFSGGGFPMGAFPGGGFPMGAASAGLSAGFPLTGFPGGASCGGCVYGSLPWSPYGAAPIPPWAASRGNRPQRAVGMAATQVGVVGGTRQVRAYSQGRSEPWCADFVSWCYERSGGSPFGHRAGVDSLASWGRQNGIYHNRGSYTPHPGDIVIFGDEQHTGLVERVDPDGTIHTIEGNTSGYGKRGGRTLHDGAVARHSYNPTNGWLTGYIDMRHTP